jgi:hypothetical protein
MESEVINRYINTSCSIEQLSKEFKVGKIKIKKILLDNNISIKKKGGQNKNRVKKEFTIDIDNKIIKCKKCGKEFNDTENKSGAAINHIKICFPDVDILSKLKRFKYKEENGSFWHFQYFDIIEKREDSRSKIKCPECEWESPDIINQTGSFTKHIVKNHNNVEEFIKKHPQCLSFFPNLTKIVERRNDLENDGVICKICDKKFKYVNQKHLDKHNITLKNYKIKYLGHRFMSNSTVEKLKNSYNEGLKYHENSFKSNPEKEIRKIIENYGFEILSNNKKVLNGTEIDIYIPELKLGIEYDGLYYHSEKMGKNKWYHLNKQNLAKSYGIKLIHIFEDEWLFKKEIIIKKIIHLIGKNNDEKIYGRQTIIKKINKNDSEIFLNKNHIQGSAPQTTLNIGSFYKDRLIGVMSFLKQKDFWVLNRFATDINYLCIGISSKILSNFINDHKNDVIITFADRRWTTDPDNNLYIKLGFKLDGIVNPDYKYYNPKINRNERIHKFNFRKKIILKNYPLLVNNTMTENEMTKIIGCDKIWDCGLFRYKMTLPLVNL